jgi:hypothetical protein
LTDFILPSFIDSIAFLAAKLRIWSVWSHIKRFATNLTLFSESSFFVEFDEKACSTTVIVPRFVFAGSNHNYGITIRTYSERSGFFHTLG